MNKQNNKFLHLSILISKESQHQNQVFFNLTVEMVLSDYLFFLKALELLSYEAL